MSCRWIELQYWTSFSILKCYNGVTMYTLGLFLLRICGKWDVVFCLWVFWVAKRAAETSVWLINCICFRSFCKRHAADFLKTSKPCSQTAPSIQNFPYCIERQENHKFQTSAFTKRSNRKTFALPFGYFLRITRFQFWSEMADFRKI